MQRNPATPLHLAKLTLVGSAICLAAYLVMLLPFPHPLSHKGFAALLWSIRLELLCVALPFLLGVATLVYNHRRLSSGINHLRFAEDDLDEARRFIELPWLRYAQVVGFFVVVLLCVVELNTHSFRGNSPVLLLTVLNPLNYLRTILRKPLASAALLDWRAMKPIHSDQWGETNLS